MEDSQFYDVLIIGGGAAGFFTAINIAENRPDLSVVILERGSEVLSKVKVSGGGRCNVTHGEFDAQQLVEKYPRGRQELRGPFSRFMTGDTMEWFESRGVSLKIEDDGRIFPTSDSSQTIIDCFTEAAQNAGVEVHLQQPVRQIRREEFWQLITKTTQYTAQHLIVATGSNPKIWKILEALGHTIVPPVPSLFTFNIDDSRIADLQGISINASIEVHDDTNKKILESEGPTLITHWGLSGPGVLKISAWGARLLSPLDYRFEIVVNWLFDLEVQDAIDQMLDQKEISPQKKLINTPCFELSKRFWQRQLECIGIGSEVVWVQASNRQLEAIATALTQARFKVTGKSTFKEEFVTAGGIELKEVNFKRFESKLHPNLYFAGEILNIDAITGGFNFQNAWTGAYLVSKAICDA
ncbi:MAG: NAD(P)/FAD-dependent oxidoreductase [Gilvibacter sp.]